MAQERGALSSMWEIWAELSALGNKPEDGRSLSFPPSVSLWFQADKINVKRDVRLIFNLLIMGYQRGEMFFRIHRVIVTQ